ncbi:hypothetical protein UFOVP309_47 [uncultured Caudovirales phage]|uniref:Uncharacterized protein n=1 Tax=uncultured Caudovirales phage TaxID=2100421 RepID=A0A6J5LQS6_9CAUD|nr:hypothetical protein UFOVP309_47 [uncultured Caudovirales phage]CAB4173398.1 hypothetical protein UFOVP946_54 [uncultured Caudovirales phage]
MNVVNQIKELLGMEVKLAQMKLQDGVTVIEAEAFEPEMAVFIVNEEERVPMPVGEYILEDGNVLKVEVEGIIASIEMPVEEAPEVEVEVETEAPAEQEMTAETATPKRVVESVTKEMFFAEIEKLRTEIAELKSVKSETVELSSDNVEVLTHNPEATTEVKMNLYSKKRGTTTLDVVLSKLNK